MEVKFENFDKSKYVYFKSNKECENYLVLVGTKKYKYMEVNSYGSGKFLKNAKDYTRKRFLTNDTNVVSCQ